MAYKMYSGSNLISKCRLLTESCIVQQINPTMLNEVGLRYGMVWQRLVKVHQSRRCPNLMYWITKDV